MHQYVVMVKSLVNVAAYVMEVLVRCLWCGVLVRSKFLASTPQIVSSLRFV